MNAQELQTLFSEICRAKFPISDDEFGTVNYHKLVHRDKFTELGNYTVAETKNYSDDQGDWETITIHFIDHNVYISQRFLFIDSDFQGLEFMAVEPKNDSFEVTEEQVW